MDEYITPKKLPISAIVVAIVASVIIAVLAFVLSGKATAANTRAIALESQLATARDDAANAKLQLNQVTAESADRKRLLDDAQASVSKLQTQVAQAQADTANIRRQLDEANAAMTSVKSDLAEAESRANTSSAEATTAQVATAKLQRQLDDAKAATTLLQTQTDAQVADLKQQLATANAKLTAETAKRKD